MKNKRKTKETKNEVKVINPVETPVVDEAREELKKRMDFANLEIKRTLERYELALLPYLDQRIVAGVSTALEAKVTLVNVKKADDKKETK